MPALPRIGEPDGAPVLDDVGEDHHLRHAGLLIAGRADVDLEVAELRAEVAQLAPGEVLVRKAHDAVLAEGAEHRVNGSRSSGRARSRPSIVAPSESPLGMTFIVAALRSQQGRCHLPRL